MGLVFGIIGMQNNQALLSFISEGFGGLSGLTPKGFWLYFLRVFWPYYEGFISEGFLALLLRVFWPYFRGISGLIMEGFLTLLWRVFWPYC